MVAACYLEVSSDIRKDAGLDRLHPSSVDAERNLILTFARCGAGVAPDAGLIVYDEAEVHGSRSDERLRGIIIRDRWVDSHCEAVRPGM